MQRAGTAIARASLDDFKEIGGLPEGARLLVLAGKGHNGGDALGSHLFGRSWRDGSAVHIRSVLSAKNASERWKKVVEFLAESYLVPGLCCCRLS